MSSKVQVTFVGDDATLAQRIEKQQAQITKLTGKLRDMGAAGRAATKKTADGLQDGFRHAMGFAAALTGVGSAAAGIMVIARQIKAEYEALRARQERAAGTQISVAEAKATAALQRPPEMTAQWLEGMVGRVSQGSGLTQAEVWRNLPGPLSAMGSVSPQAFESAMTLGSRIRARTGEGFDMNQFVGGTLDIMRLTGTADARQGLGFTRQFGAASRITDVAQQVRALAPALAAGREIDVPPEQVAELVAYFTQLGADPEGRISSTGAINLMMATQEEIMPTVRNVRGRMVPGFVRPEGATFQERLGSMQRYWAGASETERMALLKRVGGREKTKGALMGLLGQSQGAMAELGMAQQRIGAPSPEMAGLTDELMTEIESLSPAQDVRLMGEQSRERLQLLDEQAAVAGEVRQQIDAMLRNTPGISDLHRKEIMAEFEIGSRAGTRGAAGAAIRALRDVQRTKALAPYRFSFLGSTEYALESETGIGSVRATPTAAHFMRARVVRGTSGGLTQVRAEENPSFNAEAAQALRDLEAAVIEQAKRLDRPQPVEIVGDTRAKQHGGLSPQGE